MGTTRVTIKPAPLSLLVHAGLGSDAQHRLCDAAPDLLAACVKAEAIIAFDRKSIVACESIGGDVTTLDSDAVEAIETIDAALVPLRAAIAKATGATP